MAARLERDVDIGATCQLAGLAPHVGERKCLGSESPSDAPALAAV